MVADPFELEQRRVLPVRPRRERRVGSRRGLSASSRTCSPGTRTRSTPTCCACSATRSWRRTSRRTRSSRRTRPTTRCEKPENARAWLYQIAHRVALDDLRRNGSSGSSRSSARSRNTAPSAEHLVMEAHLSGELQRALERIPERQRSALLLAELHDLTGLELAAALGVSHVAARALLTRARESLRQALAAERQAIADADAAADHRPGVPLMSPPSPCPAPRTTTAPASSPPPAWTSRSRPPTAAGSTDHLAGCPDCGAVAAEYDDQRSALRSLRLAPGAAPGPVGPHVRRARVRGRTWLVVAAPGRACAPCRWRLSRRSWSSRSSSVPVCSTAGPSSPAARATARDRCPRRSTWRRRTSRS